MWFYYDHDGKRIALEYQGNLYYYIYNLQGDVVAIADSNGTICGSYEYNDWGKIIDISNIGSNTVATANPFRYRGYYYDTETELYYLNSRYYNPEWGRFVNADNIFSSSNVLGYNWFVYCNNDPINLSDETGCWPKWAQKVWKKVSNWASNNLGAQIRTSASRNLGSDEYDFWVFKVKVGSKETVTKTVGDSKPVTFYSDTTNKKVGVNVKKDSFVAGHSVSSESTEIYSGICIDNSPWRRSV